MVQWYSLTLNSVFIDDLVGSSQDEGQHDRDEWVEQEVSTLNDPRVNLFSNEHN